MLLARNCAKQMQARARQNTPTLIRQKPHMTYAFCNIGTILQSIRQFGPQLAKLLSRDLPLKHESSL